MKPGATSVICDDEGNLKESRRKTQIEIFDLKNNEEQGWIYEMGIPVVETDIPYHVNIGQKIPLNMDRDNVRPAYAKALKAIVLNATAHLLDEEESRANWVTEGMCYKTCDPEAAKKVFDNRFGENSVVFDPSDPESGNQAVADGYEIIPPNTFPKMAWGKIKENGRLRTTRDVAPTHPYSSTPPVIIPEHEWTKGIRQIVNFAEVSAQEILGKRISVQILKNPEACSLADYGINGLRFNLGRLGKSFFENGITKKVMELIIHELAHHYESNHLSNSFHRATCKVGAAMAQLGLEKPELFNGSLSQGEKS